MFHARSPTLPKFRKNSHSGLFYFESFDEKRWGDAILCLCRIFIDEILDPPSPFGMYTLGYSFLSLGSTCKTAEKCVFAGPPATWS